MQRLALVPLQQLAGVRVTLRGFREADIDDRIAYPIDPAEEDGYGGAWRHEWDGRRWRTREHLAQHTADQDSYEWTIEHVGTNIGSARLRVDVDHHCATYSIGIFVPELRGQGLGRETTGLVIDWAFSDLGVHRIQLEVRADNRRAIDCYLACGFRHEGIRRDAELYPDGWKDFILMGQLQDEKRARR